MSNQIKFKNDYEVLKPPTLEIVTLKTYYDSNLIESITGNLYTLELFYDKADAIAYTTAKIPFNHYIKNVDFKNYKKLKKEFDPKNNDRVLFIDETFRKKTTINYLAEEHWNNYHKKYYKYYNIIKKCECCKIIDYIKQCKKIIVRFLENTKVDTHSSNSKKPYKLKNKELFFYVILDNECKDKYEKYLLSRNISGEIDTRNICEYFLSTFKDIFNKYDFISLENTIKNNLNGYIEENGNIVGYHFKIIVMPDISYAPIDIQEIYKGVPQEEVISKQYNKIVGFNLSSSFYSEFKEENIYYDNSSKVLLGENEPITNQEYYTFDNVDFVSIKNNYTIEEILNPKQEIANKTNNPNQIKKELLIFVCLAIGLFYLFYACQ